MTQGQVGALWGLILHICTTSSLAWSFSEALPSVMTFKTSPEA